MRFILSFIFIFLIHTVVFSQVEAISEAVPLKGLSEQENITAPNISFDGKYLAFVVKENDTYKLYEAELISGEWSEPIELTDITKALGLTSYKNAPAYNFDASEIYFSAQNGSNTDIFLSRRTPTGWSLPVALPQVVNSIYNEDDPSISPDNNKLFFVRFLDNKTRDCGKIFLSKKDNNFEWGKSMQVIAPINDVCERSPRVLSDNRTLLFASKREKQKKFVIYYAKNLYSDVWLLPEAIGIFSKQDNLYPATDYTGSILLFASQTSLKKSKINQTKLPAKFRPENVTILTGKITTVTNKPIDGTISLLNKISMIPSSRFKTNMNNGNYKIFLPLNSEYLLDFTGEKFSHSQIDYKNWEKSRDKLDVKLFKKINLFLNVYDKDIFQPIDVKIEILNIKTGEKIKFDNHKIGAGRYKLTFPLGEKINIKLTAENIKTYNLEMDLSGIVIFDEFEKNAEIISEKVQYIFNVTEIDNNKPIDCQIVLTNLTTAKKIRTTVNTDQNGNAKIFARKGDKYELTVNPPGYAFYNKTFEVEKNISAKSIDIKLQALKQDVKIEFKNITFETNSADLNEASNEELGKIIKLLKTNPEIKVEISAHTDDVGTEAYNLKLSDKRAKSVVDYLILHDVETDRLISKGYGETQPLLPNTSEENKAQNRRVELKITEISN